MEYYSEELIEIADEIEGRVHKQVEALISQTVSYDAALTTVLFLELAKLQMQIDRMPSGATYL